MDDAVAPRRLGAQPSDPDAAPARGRAREAAKGHPDASLDGDADGGARVLVTLFDHEHSYRTLTLAELERALPLADTQLLWIDATLGALPIDVADCLALDLRMLDASPDCMPTIRWREPWLYLHVNALNWQRERQAKPVPLSLAVGPNVVVTRHAIPVDFVQSTLEKELDILQIGSLEAMTFAASLLDRMLTDYLDARDEFETTLDRIELRVLRRPDARALRELQGLRQLASRLRQHLADHRDLFDALGRPDFNPTMPDTARESCVTLRGRYAHVVAAFENARELVNGSFDLYTSRMSESTNDTMKLLTVVTVITGLMATVAGVLGMNFDAPVFDTGPRGFYAAVVGMVLFGGVAAVLSLWLHYRSRRKLR